MKRRIMSENRGGGEEYAPMSVVLYNNRTSKLEIIESDDIIYGDGDSPSHPKSIFTPIGVVVIPSDHGVLKDSNGNNQCGVMSIVPMNCTTPASGGTTEQSMYWGDSYTDIQSLVNYKHLVTTGNKNSNTANGYSDSTYAYIPIQRAVGGTPTRDRDPYAPSPYAGNDYKSGGYNESYGLTGGVVGDASNNALSDFDGPGNTKKIIQQRGTKNYSTWKPSRTTASDYPAASCCDMYSTIGTKQGDWYLPAAGELGYILPRLYDINDTISKIHNTYGIGTELDVQYYYWSSSEFLYYDGTKAIASRTYLGSGSMQEDPKENPFYARAFLRI